jgi:hypothetical protein
MAVTSIVLDIKANTDRALNDFKRFSAQLDNKFLVSGLKLDVVRNALGQINREFQKAIGEQGLQAGQSLRAAQNQAALLIDTFKSIGPAASEAIANDFSSAFSEIAVRAGGTAKDIQKALSAVPFISTDLPEDMRQALGRGVMEFQRDFSRAGLGDTYGNIVKEFLSGQVTAGELTNSTDALRSRLGAEFTRLGGGPNLLTDAQRRSQVVADFQNSKELRDTLDKMVDRANYGQFIIQDLNTRLFNPEKGVFGTLRQITMSVKDKTTIFMETRSLIDSVFGKQGLFVNFFQQIGKIFGIEDPLRIVIIGIRFITKQFEALNKFVQSPEFQQVIGFARDTFTRIKDFFTSLSAEVSKGTFDKQSVIGGIRKIGESVRSYIGKIGDAIGSTDISNETEAGSSIVGTIVEEMGKTLVALVRDVGGALLLKAPQIGLSLTGELIKAVGGVLKEAFSDPLTGTLAGGLLAYGGVRATTGALRAVGGVRDVLASRGDDRGGLRGRLNRALGSPFGRGPRILEGREAAGSTQSFYARVLGYLERIANCVCGGGGGVDIDGDTRQSRRERVRRGKGPRGPSMRPPASLPPLDDSTDLLADGLDELDGPDERRYRSERDWNRERDRRYRKKYGQGAIARRNIGNLVGRIPRIGKLGLGLLALGGVGAMINAGGVKASERKEFDPATGEFITQEVPQPQPQPGAGEAWGKVGMGAAEGALTGAMFGPWGAAIGGVIGGGVALLDKGVRDAIGKSIVNFGAGIGNSARKLWEGLVGNVMKAFDGIKNFTKGIDWKNILLDTFLPGRGLIRTAAQAAGLSRESGEGGPLSGLKNWLAEALGIGGRELGGQVIKGTSYIVGERGPEIFTPGRTGTIMSNRELTALNSRGYAGSTVSANFNISINVTGAMTPENTEALRGPILRVIEEAWASATQGSVSRGVV